VANQGAAARSGSLAAAASSERGYVMHGPASRSYISALQRALNNLFFSDSLSLQANYPSINLLWRCLLWQSLLPTSLILHKPLPLEGQRDGTAPSLTSYPALYL
jgi:hypothetical protein